MGVYHLNSNIYIVKGVKKHCIYDLNKGRLFSIDQEALDFIERITSKEELQQTENPLLKQLIDYKIITEISGIVNTSSSFIDILNEKNDKELEADVSLSEVHDKEQAVRPGITFVWIELTQACNLCCLHCYNEADFNNHAAGKKSMSLSDFKYAIDEIEKLGVRRIQLIGGEPFVLGSRLKEMLEYIKGKFDFVEIFTNGTLLREEDFKMLTENNVSRVALSVYSNIASEHDKVTKVSGSHEKLMKTIRKLEEHNIPYRIANIRMKGIDAGTNSNGPINEKSGYDFVRLSGRGNLQLYNKDLLRDKLITKERFTKKLNPETVKNNIKYNHCFSSRLYIDMNLNVYPCVMERRVMHGNIQKQSIREILKDELIFLTKDKIDDCRYCEYRYACYDCRPDSLSGKLRGKPWYCTYDPYNGEWYDIEEFINKLEVE